jgi:hypothetical protein
MNQLCYWLRRRMDRGVRLDHAVLFYAFTPGSVRERPPDRIVSSDGAHPLGVLDRVNRYAL